MIKPNRVAVSSADVARSAATTTADSRELLSIVIFSGIGLLLSLAAIIADQYLPGEWF